MQLVVSYAEREEWLEDTAKKRAKMESERLSMRMELLSIVDYDDFMAVDMVARDVPLDQDGDVTIRDETVRKPTFAVKSRTRFRSRMLKVTGRVKELGVVMKMTEPGETTTIVTQAGQVQDEGVHVGRRHQENSFIQSPRMWGQSPLTETTANRKRGWAEGDYICETKRERPNWR